MPTEREHPPRRTYVKITLNRASMGDSDSPYAVLKTTTGGIIGHIPRKDVTIDAQKVSKEMSGQLEVDIVKETLGWYEVEIELEPGDKYKLRLDKNSHELIPLRMEPVYYNQHEVVHTSKSR